MKQFSLEWENNEKLVGKKSIGLRGLINSKAESLLKISTNALGIKIVGNHSHSCALALV